MDLPQPTPEEAAAFKAKRQKLGGPQKANARIAAVRQFLEGTSSPAHADAVLSTLVRADQIEGIEKVMRAYRARPAPSAPSVPAADRASGNGWVSEAEYSKMSHGNRIEYCRRFTQPTEDRR
jgi:hypothetical protein